MKAMILGAAFAALLGGAALAEERAPAAAEDAPVYTVIQPDARISFSSTRIRGFEVGDDDSLLLRVGANTWYRATLWEPCARDLKWDQRIGFDTSGIDTFDRFSTVFVRGHRCPVRTLDQIAPPTRRDG